MNLCLFFEGTGQGVAGRMTNVTRLYRACAESDAQRRHLEAGPGTRFGAYVRGRLHGVDWWRAFRQARRWFEAQRPARHPLCRFPGAVVTSIDTETESAVKSTDA